MCRGCLSFQSNSYPPIAFIFSIGSEIGVIFSFNLLSEDAYAIISLVDVIGTEKDACTSVIPNLAVPSTTKESSSIADSSNLFELLKLHQGLKSIHYELCSGSFTQLQKLVS